MKRLFFIPVLLLVLLSCSASHQDEFSGYPNAHLLVGAEELHSFLEQEDLLVIDTRVDPGDSRIAGAVHFPSVRNLADPEHPVANYLVGPEVFQEKMRRLGLNDDTRVVIYDEGNALQAARLFYALEYYGFSSASVLNGGLESWISGEFPVTNAAGDNRGREPGNFHADARDERVCDFDTIVDAIQSDDKVIYDTRTADEYSGEDKRADKSGHIPGAVHLEWSEVLETDGIPYFLPSSEIQKQYTTLGITPDKEIIPHCQTNVRGAHAYFTLRLMGYDSVRPYEGSWAEYGNRDDAVIE